jgi:hypothetical protein
MKRFLAGLLATLCFAIGMSTTPASAAVSAADEIEQNGTNNNPPRENAACFDGTGRWLKFTTGGSGANQIAREVGAPGSPTLVYDEVPGSDGYPVIVIHSLTVDDEPSAFAEVWVYPGGRLASTFLFSPPVTSTAPKAMAPRRGNNITQLFVCAVPIVVPGPCPGGEYLWERSDLGFRMYMRGSVEVQTLNTGLVVPAGKLTVVGYVSEDGYTGRSSVSQPFEQWRVVVGGVGTGYTTDIVDYVEYNQQTGSLGPIDQPGGEVVLEHYGVTNADGQLSPNSVVPVSICVRVD